MKGRGGEGRRGVKGGWGREIKGGHKGIGGER